MNWKGRFVCIISLALSLVVIGGCVSKSDYLLKVEEGEKLSSELAALRSEHDRLRGEKEALDKQTLTLQAERNELEDARTQLQLKNLSLEKEAGRLKEDNLKLEEILRAKSDTLSKNIVDLRAHVADLTEEVENLQVGNSLLRGENNDLRKSIEALKKNLENSLDQIVTLQEKNKALQSEARALAQQREEEVKEMRNTYDNLLAGMRSEIEKGKITITQLRGKLKVNMLDEILFDSGKTTIKPQGVEVLERVGKILLNVEDRTINIEGHTDNVPIGPELGKRYPTNWELSAARATNVARYLQEKIGIDPSLLSATGYGEYQPVASNESEEGRTKNRRIEIVLVPKEIAPVSRK